MQEAKSRRRATLAHELHYILLQCASTAKEEGVAGPAQKRCDRVNVLQNYTKGYNTYTSCGKLRKSGFGAYVHNCLNMGNTINEERNYMDNFNWLIETSDKPIQYNLMYRTNGDVTSLENELVWNVESEYWLSKLTEYSSQGLVTNIHGSHDYRVENILGKLWLLGFNPTIEAFNKKVRFYIDFLNKQIDLPRSIELTFGKIYSYHDLETVLAAFLSLCGYTNEYCIQYIIDKRIKLLYEFTRQKRYDIYVDGSQYSGVKKEWQSYLINPDFYDDGNIALPSIHDYILFASVYEKLSKEKQNQVDVIVDWIFDERYFQIKGRYGYFYAPDSVYNTKSIIRKLNLLDLKSVFIEESVIQGLLFRVYIMSRFKSAQKSEWYDLAMMYLNQFVRKTGRYKFPKIMITDKKDKYFTDGGHMNVGENRKSKLSDEILSTYWMWLIEN